MEQITRISLDVARPALLIVHEKQNDSGRWIYAEINDNGAPFEIDAGAYGLVRISKPDGTACVYDSDEQGTAVIIDGNTVKVKLIDQALTAAGIATASVGVYNADAERITSFNFKLDIERDAVQDETIVSSDYYNILTSAIATAVEKTNELEAFIESATGIVYIFENATSGEFEPDATYQQFPFRAFVPLNDDVTADMIPHVNFDLTDLLSGNLAPVWETAAGGVYIYAADGDTEPVTIPSIYIVSGVVDE